jgi:predicted deacylase
VLWIGAIHGDEPEGRAATAGIADALAAVPAALDAVTVTLLEDANPDGTARRTRGNARGVDLNRNLPAPGFRPGPRSGAAPLDQPEARALHDLLLAVDPHLVLVHHSWPRRRFVNFDGPAGDLAAAFARRSGYDLRASDRLPPTPGSLGSWAGRALGIPVLTVEHRRGADPAAAWAATRDATLEAVLGGSP